MIAGMSPHPTPGLWVFCTLPDRARAAALAPLAAAWVVEEDGITLILPLDVAQAQGFDTALPMARITLQVPSALDGVGLTAAVAGALAEAGIPCNMVAGWHHDHVYVPADRRDQALALLQARAAAG
ncbi:MAG: ACT domain-containing protein [Rhodobacterales bacterium]|nr:ACT domain-containing protein [Rhodobacterales bacterium]